MDVVVDVLVFVYGVVVVVDVVCGYVVWYW